MYPKYQSGAIIIASYNLHEDDRVFVLFSKEFGLLHVRAISLRKEQSKLRQAISGYLVSKLTIIHGKSGWRLVEVSDAMWHISEIDSRNLRHLYRVFKTILDYTPSEEPHTEIYFILETLINNMSFVKTGREYELMSLAAEHDILAELGYIDARPRYFVDDLLKYEEVENNRQAVINKIMLAKQSSQL